MRRRVLLAGLSQAAASLVSCQSCPPPDLQVGDRVTVTIGASVGSGDVPCDALGFGVGATFTGDVLETGTWSSVDAPPWAQACPGYLFTGPVSVASGWTFEPAESRGAGIWGGVFTAQLGEQCTGIVQLHVDEADQDHLWVSFTPEAGPSCPEECSSQHVVTVEISRGGGSGGSAGSGGGSASAGGSTSGGGSAGIGGEVVSASGGSSGTGAGGTVASGGTSTTGGGGSPGIDPVLDQRIQALCEADCANYEELQACYSSQGSSEEECSTRCYSGARFTHYALCPEEFIAMLECAEDHPGAQDYSCNGTELVSEDDSCIPLVTTMRACVNERQGS